MSKVYVSGHANSLLTDYLLSKEYEVISVKETGAVSGPVSSHPDIYMCRLNDRIYFGDVSKLSEAYPGDVLYNAAVTGKYIICSRYTDPQLISQSGCTPICVKQGYVKCNLVVVDEHRVITEDAGIAKTLASYPEIKCLLISPGQVALPGYDYGFIGGASGRVGGELIFNGNLSAHSDFEAIKAFINDAGVKLKYFKEYPLCDIGSIICMDC